LENIPSNKFGMLKTDSFNIEENNYVLTYIYIYMCEHIIVLLSYFPSNSKYIIDMLQYKFFDVRSLM
jgi:hypothetical protein